MYIMKDKQHLLAAANAMAEGAKPIPVKEDTGGRPKITYMVGGQTLTSKELKQIAPKGSVEMQLKTGAMDDAEFQVYCRGALQDILPQLMKVAAGTDDYKFLLNLAKELADRGYGKATQAIEITNPKRDIRAAWDTYDVIDVE